MDDELIRLVWKRARSTCEYCGLTQECSLIPFEIDHIIAQKHGGETIASNLALSCFYDNSFKGPNIAGIDPRTKEICALFIRAGIAGRGIFVGMAQFSWAEPT
jgi:HNH endonuclease